MNKNKIHKLMCGFLKPFFIRPTYENFRKYKVIFNTEFKELDKETKEFFKELEGSEGSKV